MVAGHACCLEFFFVAALSKLAYLKALTDYNHASFVYLMAEADPPYETLFNLNT
jgi:hypothetical protein